MYSLAFLIATYNRVDTTKRCLLSLYSINKETNFNISIFVVDDNSPDRTGEIIRYNFPEIHMMKGNGRLFWAGGTRLAWQKAAMENNYDFYIWLNDDCILNSNAIKTLLKDYHFCKTKYGYDSIISGVMIDPLSKAITYGGKNTNNNVFLIPNGLPQKCKLINGNLVLISRKIFETIGFVSNKYTHSIADAEYGLRAQKRGFGTYISSRVVGECPRNPVTFWKDKDLNLIKRLSYLNNPKGIYLKQYILFRFKYFGFISTLNSVFKIIAKAICPNIEKYTT